jgi:decaprenylphospho-beta-D-ribofuranose 2-oxidase
MTRSLSCSTERLTGWGRSSHASSTVIEPTTRQEVLAALDDCNGTKVLARGGGRSYGDAALNAGGCVIRTTKMQAVRSFDPASGTIELDPGVTFGDLLRHCAGSGWIAPVTPGTQFATIAGAIANDVHGKNHDADGSIGDHVLWLDLVLSDGSVRRVDRSNDPELFAATIGGIGLTGIITGVGLRMLAIPSTTLRVRERRVDSLDEYLDVLQEARTRYRYSVGWIDGVATGRRLGRGILETAEHIEDPTASRRSRAPVRMPVDLPGGAINAWTVGLFNRLYFRRIRAAGRERNLDLETFFYPLDAILDWNRIYGRRGFVQFQCVIPDSEARRALHELLGAIVASGRASFLAVIKTLGSAGAGFLSFPVRGITLALDFPLAQGTHELLDRLHSITVDHGGRIYLAKDSCVSARHLRQMYPRVEQFRAVLARADPQRRMRSDMSDRLQL